MHEKGAAIIMAKVVLIRLGQYTPLMLAFEIKLKLSPNLIVLDSPSFVICLEKSISLIKRKAIKE